MKAKARKRILYYTVTDGEWFRPARRGYREACCDCGLIHRVNYRIRGGRLEIQVFRDKRATAARRRRPHVATVKKAA